jgi:hypothetical protein
MKAIILVAFLTFSSLCVKAQCLGNEDFATFQGHTVAYASCATFVQGNADNWIRSHGTPQIFTDPNPINNVAYMWSSQSLSEGIFSAFNFQQGMTYNIQVRVNAVAGFNGGSFKMYAATGLQQGALNGCGGTLPTSTSQQLIAENTDEDLGWTNYQYSFTANSNYSQFWIYPWLTSSGVQYNLYVDYVKICSDTSCDGSSATFNAGVLPVGERRNGTIYIGSSYGGSGTVTVSSTGQTTMTAENSVIMKDEFTATVTTGTFVARIDPCDNSAARMNTGIYDNRPNIDVSKFPKTDSLEIAKQRLLSERKTFTVYPNPVKGRMFVTIGSGISGLTSISIVDNNGRRVFNRTVLLKGGETLPIMLNGIQPGLYYLQITNNNTSTTEKLVIQ